VEVSRSESCDGSDKGWQRVLFGEDLALAATGYRISNGGDGATPKIVKVAEEC
jgi:hypothetical protein